MRDSNRRPDDGSDFSPRVAALVSRWTLDFCFSSLCQNFKEDKRDDLDLTLRKLEG